MIFKIKYFDLCENIYKTIIVRVDNLLIELEKLLNNSSCCLRSVTKI
ncbi:MAG: hypothetical protein K6G28_03495 [Acholeplasmatales bacterium]|nr:hypothetical protein [Acholeplasmatales bacterium]